MSLIHLALLAKAVEAQQHKTGAHRSSKSSNDKKDDTYSYHDSSVSLETFLDDLLKADPEATKLFLLLKECKAKVDAEDKQVSLEEVQRIAKEYDEQDQVLKSEIKNLEAAGITLDSSSTLTKYYRAVKVSEGHGFGGYGSYSYNPASYSMGFNGMPLTRDMIEKNINQFQIDLDKFNKENPFIDEQLVELQTKIAKQKKSIKYSPFNKSKKQSLLTDMIKLEKELQLKIEQRTLLETRSESFKALTEAQKKAILAYMDKVANCIVVGEELSKAISSSISIGHNSYNNTSEKDRNVHQRMLEKVVETGEFTMEEIEAIIERVKATTEEHKVGYSSYKRLIEQSYTVWPTSPESMFAASYYNKYYQDKNKTKK